MTANEYLVLNSMLLARMMGKLNLNEWRANSPASDEDILRLVEVLSGRLPNDFLEFLKMQNGGEGFIGSQYVVLWSADQLLKRNLEYQVNEYLPGGFLIGSDGGDEAISFDFRSQDCSVMIVPFLFDWNAAIRVADSFSEFLDVTSKRGWFS